MKRATVKQTIGRSGHVAMALIMLASLTTLATPGEGQAADSPDDVALDAAIANRKVLGLPADRADVRVLMSSSADVGTTAVGIPMTPRELEDVDMDGRVRFADRAARALIPYLESQASYAGSWIDQKADGWLVVMLTKRDQQVINGIEQRMPNGKRGWRLELADTPMSALESALRRAFDVSEDINPSAVLGEATIDTKQNRLTPNPPMS